MREDGALEVLAQWNLLSLRFAQAFSHEEGGARTVLDMLDDDQSVPVHGTRELRSGDSIQGVHKVREHIVEIYDIPTTRIAGDRSGCVVGER